MATGAAWLNEEQLRGKRKKRFNPNQPFEERIKTGDAVGRRHWRSSMLGDPGVKFLGGELEE
jgi:hypothetical protein